MILLSFIDISKRLIFFTFIIFLLAVLQEVSAQSDSVFFMNRIENDLYEQLETLVEEESEVDFADQIEILSQHVGSKIDLNRLTPETAFQILHITDYQYYQLQLYIEKYGELVSIYELAAVDGFSEKELERLSPYLIVSTTRKTKVKFKDLFLFPKHELLFRFEQVLEKKNGYDTTRSTHYQGSPQRLAFRYKWNTKHLSLGLAGEKDAGEEFFRGSQKQGFDHYSFHLNIKDIGILNSLVIGDYRLNFGQGLVAGSGFMGSKGSGVSGVRAFSSGIQPVTSMNEGDYLRGAALKIGKLRYSGVVFYGYRCYDGEIAYDEEDELSFDGSLSLNGYHRTMAEIMKKRNIVNHVYGFDFQHQGRIYKIGARALKSDFSVDILPNDAPYKLFDFSGKSYHNFAVDYQLILGKTILFGEVGMGREWRMGFLQGAILQLDPRVKMSALFRYYDPQFIALMGKAFGENSKNQNETGLYLATDIILNAKMELSLYSDLYYFQWLRYQVDRPSMGMEIGSKMRITLNRRANIELLYFFKKREKNRTEGIYWKELAEIKRHKVRGMINYAPFQNIKLKTQVDFIYNVNGKSSKPTGLLIFQDLSLTIPKINTDVKLRLAFFDTDSYEERLYAYENDLYYVFNITGYYYRGWRGYLVLKYQYRFFSVWFRIAQTYYIDRKSISSGLEMIDKPHKTEVKMQLLFKL